MCKSKYICSANQHQDCVSLMKVEQCQRDLRQKRGLLFTCSTAEIGSLCSCGQVLH